ncbi:unnamed protein product [Allacma fusca]|uniref:Uncharacterized protein n=1 Tax=Allacma fusca TaxID=39272 RepID=A0A8J2KUH3_9HEXA|nr:unnamed protein product [Allacma fusca]
MSTHNQDGDDTPEATLSQQNIMSMRSSSSRRGSVFDTLKRFPSVLNERRRSFLGVATSKDALGGSKRSSAISTAVGIKTKSTHTGATFTNAALAVTFGAETYEHKVERPKPVIIPDFVPIAGITVAGEIKESSSKCR